jgi:lipase maturation factor 1
LFLRGIGLIYLSAFTSFAVQALGLIGSHGILPPLEFITTLSTQLGAERYWLIPMVFWLDSSDFTIQVVCWGGAVLSMLLVFGILPRLSLLLLYILYLSLIYAGQVFMSCARRLDAAGVKPRLGLTLAYGPLLVDRRESRPILGDGQ